MASILAKVGTATNTPVQYFEADTQADMNAIDVTYVPMGSRCYVINNGNNVGAWYALTSTKQWYLVPTGAGWPSGEVIFDGGDLDA